MSPGLRRALVVLAAAVVAWAAGAGRAEAQLGSLISPGKLARAHGALEGLSNCQKCHEQGRKVTAGKCLTCHEPVARRIAARRGVHRDVTDDCVSCHVEHAGVDGELRPFDTRRFDHAGVAGYPLDGKHAKVAGECQACHKTRSYLSAGAACATCHTDVHKGTLGKDCAACHTTQVAFTEPSGRFDHARTAFPLTGAHRTAACETCHVNKVYKGLKFESCADCHSDRHRRNLGSPCASCHTTDTWRTKKIDHARTSFALTGKHVSVGCAECHVQPPMKATLKADTCASCHKDVHAGSFKQDCKACHSETSFADAPFDHATTPFHLTGKHEGLRCIACHTTPAAASGTLAAVDFRGLKTDCVACHRDIHDATLGAACETCHSTTAFSIAAYAHKQQDAPFFGGEHAPLTCDKCHTSRPKAMASADRAAAHVTFTDAGTTCSSCHTDVHLGQVGAACESCHSIREAKFKVVGFSHEKSAYPLTGRHAKVACDQCHKREAGAFPGGSGEAVRLKGLSTECRTCHQDVHAGQIARPCDACHTTAAFTVSRYTHQSKPLVASGFFSGRHAAPACQACHKRVTAEFPAGRATAVRYAVDARCTTCHTDVHRGTLGSRCIDCHKI